MPIVKMTSRSEMDEAQARAEMEANGGENLRWSDEYEMWLYDTHTGLCLYETERNLYHDSDFFMVVWNEEKGAAESLPFATTRAWTYPCFSSHPDATDEVREKYEVWRAAEDEKRRQARIAQREAALQKQLDETGLAEDQLVRIIQAVGQDVWTNRYMPLLRSDHAGRLRSEFRKSLASQVRAWIAGESDYPTPLSRKQEMYL